MNAWLSFCKQLQRVFIRQPLERWSMRVRSVYLMILLFNQTMMSVVVNEFGAFVEWYWCVKSEVLNGLSFLVPLSTMNPKWAGSGSKPRPLSRETINVTLAWPWSYLWEIGCKRGTWNYIPQDWIQWHLPWTLDYITTEFGWHVIEINILILWNVFHMPWFSSRNLVM